MPEPQAGSVLAVTVGEAIHQRAGGRVQTRARTGSGLARFGRDAKLRIHNERGCGAPAGLAVTAAGLHASA
jgi:hypothetical protein